MNMAWSLSVQHVKVTLSFASWVLFPKILCFGILSFGIIKHTVLLIFSPTYIRTLH